MRHTQYWYEQSVKEDWPTSAYAVEEEEGDLGDEGYDPKAVPTTFYFVVESTGSLAAKEIVRRGLEVMISKLLLIRSN